MNQKIVKKADGTVEIPITFSKKKIAAAYQKQLQSAASNTQIKGFRKGKAPLDMVEKNFDKTKLYQKVLENLLPQVISKSISKHKLKPISEPQLKPITMKEDQDWKFTLILTEIPQFKLGNYKTIVKKALTGSKIWLPGDDKTPPKSEDKQSLQDKRIKKIFDALLDNIKIPIAKNLIEAEVNRALSKLLNQVQKLGLTIDQYLKSMSKTSKSIRAEYTKTARENLKLEFILQKIGQDLNISVSDGEIDTMTKAVPTPQQRSYLKSIIAKRKTIDSLLKLA